MFNLIISPDTERENRLPPGQWLTDKFPVEDLGKRPQIDLSKWTFQIRGLVENEKTFTWDEFTSLPMIKVYSDIHCVTTWSKLDNTWEGISVSEIKKLVNILPESECVMVHSTDGYSTNLLLADFFAEDNLFALKLDNEPLSAEYGFPVRLIVPRLYYWKSAKWVCGLEFIEKEVPGYWESRGYHIRGNPWEEERYS